MWRCVGEVGDAEKARRGVDVGEWGHVPRCGGIVDDEEEWRAAQAEGVD